MKRRAFLKGIALTGLTTLTCQTPLRAAQAAKEASERAFKAHAGFTLWQLPSQVNTIGNSYVLLSNKGHVVVMDGGMKEETPFLRGFIAALGNHIDAWFISHPHSDHMGALNEILKAPEKMTIKTIYHSRFSNSLAEAEPSCKNDTDDFYHQLDTTTAQVVDLREPGLVLKLGGLNLKILGVTNEEFRMNPYNNSSTIIRAWDKQKSVVFLADAGVECGNKVLNSSFAEDLNCDYLQMAHHGQQGCDEKFYKTVQFHACLWPTPTWVWNNDAGKGINTHILKTFDTRRWMDEKGIKEHHVSCLEGLWKLD